MESRFRPASKEPVPHHHPRQEELFTVLKGSILARMNGTVRQSGPGEQLHLPPCTVHSMWNAGDVPALVNWKVMPAMDTENFLENGIGLANDGKVNEKGMPSLLQAALIANRFSGVFRSSKPPYRIQRLLFALLAPVAYLKGYRSVYKKYLD